MVDSDYYGKKHGTTHLAIYTEPDDGSERIVHRQLQDQEAYDTWHLAFYFKEILTYKSLLEKNSLTLEELPRKEKNLLIYLILAARPELRSVLELGSSLYEMIDGLELVEKYVRTEKSPLPQIKPEDLKFIGVELSEILSQASKVLHPDYAILLHPSAEEVTDNFDFLYDRSVTNYAFETVREVADFVNKAEVALLNIYFAREETFTSSRLGKLMTYFSLEETVLLLKNPLYHLFGERAPGPLSGQDISRDRPVVEGFFLCCEPEFAQNFMAMARRDPAIKAYFEEKRIVPKDALTFLKN